MANIKLKSAHCAVSGNVVYVRSPIFRILWQALLSCTIPIKCDMWCVFFFLYQIYCAKGLLPMLHITNNQVRWGGNSLNKQQIKPGEEPTRAMQVLPPHPTKGVAWQTRISQPVSSKLPNTARRRKVLSKTCKAELATKPVKREGKEQEKRVTEERCHWDR